MKKDPIDGLPLVAQKPKCLGVRSSGWKVLDVDVEAGVVKANRKGMSVSHCWRELPGFLIPAHLNDGHNGAEGEDMEVYVHGKGTGPFAEGLMAPGLEVCFKPGTQTAGNVCPVTSVPLKQYEDDLAATRSGWEVDES